MAVSIDELVGSPTGGFTSGGKYSIQRRVIVAWGDIAAYSQELMPPSFATGNSSSQSLGQEFPGNPTLRVMSFTWSPHFGGNVPAIAQSAGGVNFYDQALFTIDYGIPDIEDQDDEDQQDPVPLLSHSGQGGGQFLLIPGETLQWEDLGGSNLAPVSSDAKPGVFVGTTGHSVTWPRVPRPPWDNLENLKGMVNRTAFTLRGYAYPPETLLYLNYSFSRDVMSDGNRAWKITLNFESKQVRAEDEYEVNAETGERVLMAGEDGIGGHNHFWRKGLQYDPTEKRYVYPPGFYRIEKRVVRPDNISDEAYLEMKRIYKTEDFNKLFRSGSID